MSDYNFLMESRLSLEQYKVLGLIGRLAAEQGLNLYLVGGAVRDLTYGQQVVRDLDFAVDGNPLKILRHLPTADSAQPQGSETESLLGEPPAAVLDHQDFDSHFSSAELRFTNGVRAELAMSRQEVYARPGKCPEVYPAMIFDDLKRRDFSINAMAVSLHPNSRGLLLDPTNGAADIERHELRALHPRSFAEDPVRIYRLLRLGSRLNFKPDDRTQNWVDAAVENRVWEHLEPEQQGRELRAILQEDNPARVFKLLADRKLLTGLDKKLASTRIPSDRFAKIRTVIQSLPGADPYLLNCHCLLEKLSSSDRLRLAKKIVGENKTIKLILGLERDAKKLERVLGSSKASLPSQVYLLLWKQPFALLLFLLASSAKPKAQNRIKNFLFKYPQVRAKLPRAELQALGLKPGAEFEKVLARIFLEQLDGKINTHQQLLKRLRELAGIKEPPPKTPAPKAKTAAAPGAHPARKGKESSHAPEPGQPSKPAGGKALADRAGKKKK